METLERALREAADLAPDSLGADEAAWVGGSWRRGRRRRTVRRATTAAGVIASILVIAGLVLSTTVGAPRGTVPADGGDGARRGASSFPQRIGHQWWVRDLPQAPGPMAGVLEVVATEQDPGTWQALTPDGTRYWLPGAGDGTYPALSADGTRLGRVVPGGDYVVTDLLTGGSTAYDQVGSSQIIPGSKDEFVGGRRYGLQMQAPGFFSPSGRSLALLAGPATGTVQVSVLVLGEGGTTTEVQGMGQPAGWLDEDRLLGRVVPQGDRAMTDREVRLVVWDRRTGRTQHLRTVRLPDPGAGLVAQLNGQWWGSMRADGTLWLDADVHPGTGAWSSSERWLVGYRPETGEAVDLAGRVIPGGATEPAKVVDEVQQPPSSLQAWRGTVPVTGTDGEVEQIWEDGRVIIGVQSAAVAVQRVVFAQDAIDGSPSWTPFGSTDLLVLWWWKEIALAAVAVVLWRWWLGRRRASPGRGTMTA